MAVAGLRLHVQIEEMSQWVRRPPQVQARGSQDGMKHQPVRWALQLLCSPLEKPLWVHLP